MYETNPLTGLFGKVKKSAARIIPVFARPNTNQNPQFNRGTSPRLRHFKKSGGKRLVMPANVYSQKELATQQKAVADYHASLDKRKQRELLNLARKVDRHIIIQGRREFKANKPVFE